MLLEETVLVCRMRPEDLSLSLDGSEEDVVEEGATLAELGEALEGVLEDDFALLDCRIRLLPSGADGAAPGPPGKASAKGSRDACICIALRWVAHSS